MAVTKCLETLVSMPGKPLTDLAAWCLGSIKKLLLLPQFEGLGCSLCCQVGIVSRGGCGLCGRVGPVRALGRFPGHFGGIPQQRLVSRIQSSVFGRFSALILQGVRPRASSALILVSSGRLRCLVPLFDSRISTCRRADRPADSRTFG